MVDKKSVSELVSHFITGYSRLPSIFSGILTHMSDIIINKQQTYIATIKNSVGSKQFQNIYASVDGEELDILRNGGLSCAWYVSCLLQNMGLISKPHTTVTSTEAELEESGWQKVNEAKTGDILVWESHDFEGEHHMHIGFYMGNERAISNSATDGVPKEHDWLFRETTERKITQIYRYNID